MKLPKKNLSVLKKNNERCLEKERLHHLRERTFFDVIDNVKKNYLK